MTRLRETLRVPTEATLSTALLHSAAMITTYVVAVEGLSRGWFGRWGAYGLLVLLALFGLVHGWIDNWRDRRRARDRLALGCSVLAEDEGCCSHPVGQITVGGLRVCGVCGDVLIAKGERGEE